MKLSLHDLRQVRLCLRRRAALDSHRHDDAIQPGSAITLLPLRGCVEGRPTRCWLHELSPDAVTLLARQPMACGEPFMLRLPREGDAGLWLRCRAIDSRATHEGMHRVAAVFESHAKVTGLGEEPARKNSTESTSDSGNSAA